MVEHTDTPTPRRGIRALAAACLAVLLPACTQDGHFTVLGYTTQPNYNCEIRTVRVPIFKNYTFRRGLEFDLTREVVKQIEQKTPYKVVGEGESADTELVGTITLAGKNIINRNQLNEVREAETNLAVELVWRDLRSGEILSRPRDAAEAPVVLAVPPQPSSVVGPVPPPAALLSPPPEEPAGPPKPPPVVIVQSLATFIPELGESIATAYQKNVQRLATQIVAMMEAPW